MVTILTSLIIYSNHTDYILLELEELITANNWLHPPLYLPDSDKEDSVYEESTRPVYEELSKGCSHMELGSLKANK